MKHIAVIGSHTQFLTAISALQYNHAQVENTLIIYVRNYINKLVYIPYETLDLSDIYSQSLSATRKIKVRREIINILDDLIHSFCRSESFTLYVAHTCTAFFQILATNQLCSHLNLIQEAALAFKSRFLPDSGVDGIISTIYNNIMLSDKRCWRTKKWKIPEFLKARLNYNIMGYAINDYFKYSHDLKDVIKIEWPSVNFEYKLDTDNYIFIFDGFVEMKCVELENYCKIIDKMLSDHSTAVCYVKYHPAQSTETKRAIASVFSNHSVKIVEIEPDIPFEFLISKYDNLKIVGFFSSLLEFARVSGKHSVWFYNDDLIAISSRYKKWYQNDI